MDMDCYSQAKSREFESRLPLNIQQTIYQLFTTDFIPP